MAADNSQQGKRPSPLPDDVVRRNFRRWWIAMELSHEMMMAGLRDRHGSEEAARKAYRGYQIKRRAEKLAAYEKSAKRYYALQAAKKNQGTDDAS